MLSNKIGEGVLKALMLPFYADPEAKRNAGRNPTAAGLFGAYSDSEIPGSDPYEHKPKPKHRLTSDNRAKYSYEIGILDAEQVKLPRFLFRGFRPESGGGTSRLLNSADGITPHAFLEGKVPTTIYDIPDLRSNVCGHLCGDRVQTHFSSWAAELQTALGFAGHGPGSMIAILDTSLLESHVTIHHVPSLGLAKLGYASYPEEYLAYGPIAGPAFHCVSHDALKALGFYGRFATTSRKYWPSRCKIAEAEDVKTLVAKAKEIGRLFRAKNDRRPDVVIAVAALLLGSRASFANRNRVYSKQDLDVIATCLSQELESVRIRSSRGNAARLVNPKMYTLGLGYTQGCDSLVHMVKILVALEDRARG